MSAPIGLNGLSNVLPLGGLEPIRNENPIEGGQPIGQVAPAGDPLIENIGGGGEHLPEVPLQQPNPPRAAGAFNTFVSGFDDVEDKARVGEGKLYETADSFEGKVEVIVDAVQGYVDKFIDGGRAARIAQCRAECEAMEKERGPDDKLVREMWGHLDSLVGIDMRMSRVRKDVLKNVSDALGELKKACDNKTWPPEVRLKAERDALDGLRKQIRNFRFSFDRDNGLDSGYSWFRRNLDNLFSDKMYNESSFAYDRDLADRFAASYKKLRADAGKRVDVGGRDFSIQGGAGKERAKALSNSLHDINSYIRGALSSKGTGGYYFSLVKNQLAKMAEHGGKKTTEFYVGAGGGFKIGGVVDARVMAKYAHQYRITCEGNGTVTVEHLDGFGLDVQAKFGKEGVVGVGGQAEAGARHGHGIKTFKDVNAAARYLSSGLTGHLNPHFLWSGISTLGLSALKNVLLAPVWIGKGVDALIRLATRSYDSNVHTNDHKFVARLKEGGVLSKMAQHILPGANQVLTTKGSYDEVHGSVGVDAKAQVGIARLGANGSLAGVLHKGEVTKQMPYLSALEGYYVGLATQTVGGYGENPPATMFAAETSRSAAAAVTGRETSAQDVISHLHKMVEECNDFAEERNAKIAAEKNADAKRAKLTETAEFYRNATMLAVALFEKWESLAESGKVDDSQRAEYAKVADLLRGMLINPAVKLAEDVFNDRLMVTLADKEADDYTVTTKTVGFNYDLMNSFGKTTMTAGGLLDDSGQALNAGKLLLRTGHDTASNAVEKVVGSASNRIEAEIITRKPIGKGKGAYPWSKMESTVINVKTGKDSLLVDAILLPIAQHLAENAGKKPPTDAEAALDCLKTLGGAAVSTALTRAIKDIKAHILGSSGSEDMAKDIIGKAADPTNPLKFVLGKMDITGGRNIQINFEGGRLKSIALGDHYKIDLRADFGEVIVGEVGLKMDSVENRDTYWLHPSTNSVAAKCESYFKAGNFTDWSVFVTKNRHALARFDGIARAAQFGENSFEEKVDREDCESFRELADAVKNADYSSLPPDRKLALEGNRERFLATLDAVRNAGDLMYEPDLDKTLRAKQLFECIVRHFTLTKTA